MPDPRFFESLGPVTLAELAAVAGAELSNAPDPGALVRTAAPLGRADEGSVSFLGDKRYLAELRATRAGACLVPPAHAAEVPSGAAALVTREPQVAYARAAARLFRERTLEPDDPPIHPEAEIEAGVVLSHGVVVGKGARIGAGTRIGPNSVIGPGVAIGRDCRVGANVSIGHALIGDRVVILAGAVIGEAGFGVGVGAGGIVDMPQLGRAILQDGVTLGACSCIDRGAWDDTVVGENTKIDNLVQIAHNVRLGRNCVLAAHTGISGSVTVGDGAQFGGRAGIADHVDIGAGARIAAASGVMKDVPAGETWGGAPARQLRRFMRETAWLARMAHGRTGGQ
jgi:UDP-3-O-[3-hydroxymyristoyl] glucosamine N-acyltransferase